MEYNEKKFSIDAAKRKGRPLPKWYLDEPPMYPGDDFFLTAFHQLGSERQVADIPGAIPWSKIVQYADRRKLDEDTALLFEHVISIMDKSYIEWVVKKQKALKPKGRNHGGISN